MRHAMHERLTLAVEEHGEPTPEPELRGGGGGGGGMREEKYVVTRLVRSPSVRFTNMHQYPLISWKEVGKSEMASTARTTHPHLIHRRKGPQAFAAAHKCAKLGDPHRAILRVYWS